MEFILNHPILFGALFMVLIMLLGPQLTQWMGGVKSVSVAQAVQIMNQVISARPYSQCYQYSLEHAHDSNRGIGEIQVQAGHRQL